MKKLVLFFVVAALLAGGSWYEVAYANVVPREVQIGDQMVLWPNIRGLPDAKVQKKLNNILQEELNSLRLSDDNEEDKITVYASYSVDFSRANMLSLTITETLSPERAAHPISFLKAYTMNTHTGQTYQLPDLFKAGSDYAARINKSIEQQIAAGDIQFISPYNGIAETNQRFYLTDHSVVLFYQIYEYTPYVYGFLKFEIPYEQLSDILLPEISQAVLAARTEK